MNVYNILKTFFTDVNILVKMTFPNWNGQVVFNSRSSSIHNSFPTNSSTKKLFWLTQLIVVLYYFLVKLENSIHD